MLIANRQREKPQQECQRRKAATRGGLQVVAVEMSVPRQRDVGVRFVAVEFVLHAFRPHAEDGMRLDHRPAGAIFEDGPRASCKKSGAAKYPPSATSGNTGISMRL